MRHALVFTAEEWLAIGLQAAHGSYHAEKEGRTPPCLMRELLLASVLKDMVEREHIPQEVLQEALQDAVTVLRRWKQELFGGQC